MLPKAASADPPPATLTGELSFDQVRGNGFAPDGLVMVQIYGAFGGPLLFNGTAPTDAGGNFGLFRHEHGQDLVPGMFLQATDGNVAKVLTLAALTIDVVDRTNDVVSGTAAPATTVDVNVFDPPFGGSAFLQVAADGSGLWSADFTGSFDLTFATYVSASVPDGDGDRTEVNRQPPRINASLTFDNVNGFGFAPSASVTVDIYDAPAGTLLSSDAAATDAGGSFFLDRSQHGQDLVPAMHITVTDGTDTKELTLVALTIDSVDAAEDDVSGSAPPTASVNVNVFSPPFGGGAFLQVAADGAGQWTADFTGSFDITGATFVNANAPDDDGDSTQVDEQPPNINASLTFDNVNGFGFAPSASVTVDIYDAPGGTLLSSDAVATDTGGSFFLDRSQHGQDLVPAMHITVTDGTDTKELTLVALTIDTVDAANDVVSGTAPPTTSVNVNVSNPPFGGSFLQTTADGAGQWTADFTGIFDITGASHASANVADEDGDTTFFDKQPPTFQADLTFDEINGGQFAPDATVTVTIDESPGGTELFSGTASTDSFGNFGVGPDQHGVDLVPGQAITVSDGTDTKDLTLVHLVVDTVDPVTDIVSGESPPGALVGVNVFNPPFGGAFLQVTADGAGQWTADFTGVFDITLGTGANARVSDTDGDASAASKNPPQIDGNLTFDHINGHGFEPNASVTISIDGSPAGFAPTDGSGGFFFENAGVDLVTGSFVAVTDGTTTKDVTLVSLSIETLDATADEVAGTSPPGALVGVGVFEPQGGGGSFIQTTADGSGLWAADFTGSFDMTVTTGANANVIDADGDTTSVDKQPPTIDANLTFDHVGGRGFEPTSTVTVDIYDAPGGTLLATGPAFADGAGEFFFDQEDHHQEFAAGMHAVASDGTTTKAVTMVDVGITNVDRVADDVDGTAPPGSAVNVSAFDATSDGFIQTTADGAGTWAVDFTGTFDLTVGTDVYVAVPDGDGDVTSAEQPPPSVDGSLPFDDINGNWFAPDSAVSISISDSPGGTELFSDTVPTGTNGSFGVGADQHGLNLVPGMLIVASDGTDTKELTLADLTVDAVDPDTDTVSGTSEPFGQVNVDVCCEPGGGEFVSVTADGSGLWSADFSAIFDVTSTTHAHVNVNDSDRDTTSADRSATSIVGNLTHDLVFGDGFAPDTPATVDVYDAPGGTLLTSIATTTGSAGFFQVDAGLDLVAGMAVVASDGTLTRDLELATLTIDSVDEANDDVSGSAPAGASVLVGAFGPFQGAEMTVAASGAGAWTADFSGLVDIDPTTSASAEVPDSDGDRTRFEDNAPACVLDGSTLTILTPEPATVHRTGNQIEVLGTGLDDPTCGGATVFNVDLIERPFGEGGPLTIDLSGGTFTPGATSEGRSSEIEFDIGGDIVIHGTEQADVITLGDLGINLNNDSDVDVTGCCGSAAVNGAGGNDQISAAGGAGTGSPRVDGVVISGGAGNDTLTGGLGDDEIHGDAGKDVIAGREGANTVDGGNDIDVLSYAWSPSGVTVELEAGSATGTTFSDAITAIEDVIGSVFADVLGGNLSSNVLDGQGGNDFIDVQDGLSGNDTAIGGSGTDTCLADTRDRKRSCEG